jgi:Cu(I)/Ag(I) efflux system membrane protein CusA/SilA
MFFASFLGITLVPVLMVWLIRGKITPKAKNPVNRFAYQPCVNFVLRHRKLTLAFAFAILAATAYPFFTARQGIHAAVK